MEETLFIGVAINLVVSIVLAFANQTVALRKHFVEIPRTIDAAVLHDSINLWDREGRLVPFCHY
jgi:hypothetical protein